MLEFESLQAIERPWTTGRHFLYLSVDPIWEHHVFTWNWKVGIPRTSKPCHYRIAARLRDYHLFETITLRVMSSTEEFRHLLCLTVGDTLRIARRTRALANSPSGLVGTLTVRTWTVRLPLLLPAPRRDQGVPLHHCIR